MTSDPYVGRPTTRAETWDDMDHRIVQARGHHCLRERRGEPCAGVGACTAMTDATDGLADGYRCKRCGRWAETMEAIPHRYEGCVVPKIPLPVKRVRRSPLLSYNAPVTPKARRRRSPR